VAPIGINAPPVRVPAAGAGPNYLAHCRGRHCRGRHAGGAAQGGRGRENGPNGDTHPTPVRGKGLNGRGQ
jgi:hypothetical protein